MERCLKTLQWYGLQNTTLNWFKSYIFNRTKYVEHDGVASAKKHLEAGVPQDSLLCPLLYGINMNDIQTVSERLNFVLYADDTTLTRTLCTFTQEVDHALNRMSYSIILELTKLSHWLAVDKFSLNVDVTKYVIFHNHQNYTHEILRLVINNTAIETVTEFNFGGLTIN